MPYRIPTAHDDFDSFINSTATALLNGTPTTAERLGLTAEQLAKWQDYRTVWKDLFATYTNRATRTKAVTNGKNKVRKEFIAFASPLLTAMSVHPALTASDRLTFHLAERDRIMTKRGSIKETAEGHMEAVGGARVQVRVRTFTDSTRASMHPQAHYIEMRYMTVAPQGMGPSGLTWPATPLTPMECPQVTISTRALFYLELGEHSRGMRVYAFFRWVNASEPNKSGPWGTVRQVIVA